MINGAVPQHNARSAIVADPTPTAAHQIEQSREKSRLAKILPTQHVGRAIAIEEQAKIQKVAQIAIKKQSVKKAAPNEQLENEPRSLLGRLKEEPAGMSMTSATKRLGRKFAAE